MIGSFLFIIIFFSSKEMIAIIHEMTSFSFQTEVDYSTNCHTCCWPIHKTESFSPWDESNNNRSNTYFLYVVKLIKPSIIIKYQRGLTNL